MYISLPALQAAFQCLVRTTARSQQGHARVTDTILKHQHLILTWLVFSCSVVE